MADDLESGPQFRALNSALRDKGPGDKKKKGAAKPAAEPARAPSPPDLGALEAALMETLHRGGKLPVGEPYSIPTDSGFARGGEFTDEEGAAYNKRSNALRQLRDEQAMASRAKEIRGMADTKADATDVARTRTGLADDAAKRKADTSQKKWESDSSKYVNDEMDVHNFFGPGDAKKIIQDGDALGWFQRAQQAYEDRGDAKSAHAQAQAAGVRNPDEHTAALIHHLVNLQQR